MVWRRVKEVIQPLREEYARRRRDTYLKEVVKILLRKDSDIFRNTGVIYSSQLTLEEFNFNIVRTKIPNH
jgi:hypothetical protein